MNVTELARKLKVPTKELLEMLPEMGFDIGRKAIKINNSIANKISRDWKFLYAKYRRDQEAKLVKEKIEVIDSAEKKVIQIPEYITARELAVKSGISITTLLTELMRSGSLTSMNEKIDFETAQIIGQELGIEIERQKEDFLDTSKKEKKDPSATKSASLKTRPPIVVIMGHVDHGKTLLLDTIRKTNVIGQESGGITQHIGAYQIEKVGRKITFIDTPGHEAFTTMRSRGAKVADIAILVIAADDGIKPQTKESIKIIKSGGLPMIVAMNKIDKPEANVERVKQQLASEDLLPEDWGGQTITVPISAKTGQGIDTLIETILLLSDMEKENIQADPNMPASVSIVESHIDIGQGPLATAIVQQGTLRQGDLVFSQDMYLGKIKLLQNFIGKTVTEATPSMPIKILGLKGLPSVGDVLDVRTHIEKKNKVKNYLLKTQAASAYTPVLKKQSGKETEKLNIIIRTDVLGSLEAIIASIGKIKHADVEINIIGKGLGHITENDVLMAYKNDGYIFTFHTTPTQSAALLGVEKNIPIYKFKIIYELLDKVKELLEKKLKPLVEIKTHGTVKVLKVFKKERSGIIIGGKIIKGKAVKGAKAKILRQGVELGKGIIRELQSNKRAIQEADFPTECGILFEGPSNIQEDDELEVYEEIVTEKKLASSS